MVLFKGGISKVEFAATNSWPGTELPDVRKETKIEIKTPTEDNAAGKQDASGKQVTGSIVCSDVTDTPWATLRGYEEAHTPFFLKITGINTAQYLILKSVQGIVELQPNEAGKTWKRVLNFSGFADTEANLLTLNLS
jgi:hypothetical protein